MMKLNKLSVLLIALLWLNLSSCGQKQQKDVSADQVQKTDIVLISPAELNEANQEILLIDVRTPEEYGSGHIENSINIDISSDNFKDKIAKLGTDQEVYVYCLKGGRSGKAAKMMRDMGFEKIYDLKGGILQWEKDGFEKVQ